MGGGNTENRTVVSSGRERGEDGEGMAMNWGR